MAEVHDIVQEAVIKTIPKKKKCKKVKWLSEEAFQIAEKRRSERQRRKGKIYAFECRGPKNRRRDKKAFFSDQCKEIEKSNRIRLEISSGKLEIPREHFMKKMGTIKDRNGIDLKEAEFIKKSWQEYTEELYKKDLHDPDNHDGVITHLEPDILECEVKWALGSITMNKASGDDGIPVE